MKRFDSDRLVALVEMVVGVVAAGYFVQQGIVAERVGGVDRTALDHAFPFVLAAGLLVMAAVGVRRWRKAGHRDTDVPAPGNGPSSPAPEAPVVPLSEPGARRVATIVDALRVAGVLAPQAPDPTLLHEAVADAGEPVTVDSVLAALFEADLALGNLAFHASHTEQHDEHLREQIADLVRLSAGALAVSVLDIQQSFVADGAARNRTRIHLSIDGDELLLDYPGLPKYLSTQLHVALATALRATGAPRRLAWLWSDQGGWLTALPERGVERFNAELGLDAAGSTGWEWVDEQEPVAAGA